MVCALILYRPPLTLKKPTCSTHLSTQYFYYILCPTFPSIANLLTPHSALSDLTITEAGVYDPCSFLDPSKPYI